jgi:hypothetical protein
MGLWLGNADRRNSPIVPADALEKTIAPARVPGFRISWSHVLRRTVAEITDDNCFGLAAQLA